VSPVKYEKGFYIPEDTILHSLNTRRNKETLPMCLYVSFEIGGSAVTVVTSLRAGRSGFGSR
jgi:hypothetical protein